MKRLLGLILVFTMIFTNANMTFAEEEKTVIDQKYEKISSLGVVDHIASFSQDLARFENEGKWGYIDIYGNIVIEPQFDYVCDFRNGVANAIVDGKEGIIDRTGKWVFDPVVDFDKYYITGHTSDLYKKGYVVVRKSNVDGFAFQVLNKNAREVLKDDFEYICPVSPRLEDISKKNRNDEDIYFNIKADDKEGVIGIDGKYLVKPEHDIYVAYPVEENNEYYIKSANNDKIIMTINKANNTNKFKSALKTYGYTHYDRENTTEDRFKNNYYSTKICNDAGDSMKIGEPVIDKKYHELEITRPDLTGTALANVFEKDEIDFIDFRNEIKVVKTIKGKIGYVEKDGYFFRYLEQIGDDWVYVLLNGEGQEIGRYRNYFEHYYSSDQKTEYRIGGSLLNPLYGDEDNLNTILNKINRLRLKDINMEIKEQKYQDVDQFFRHSDEYQSFKYYSYSTDDGLINDFDQVEPLEWNQVGRNYVACHVIRGRIEEILGDIFTDGMGGNAIEVECNKDGDIQVRINIYNWATNEHQYDGSTPYLMIRALEVLKIMTNQNDGELIWRFLDSHIKSGIKIDCSRIYTFGKTKVKFKEDEIYELVMNYKDIEGSYNIIIVND